MAHDEETRGAGQDGAGNGGEKRAAPRFTLLIRAAKLIVDDSAEFLCVIRDASATGLKIRMFTPLPPYRSSPVKNS